MNSTPSREDRLDAAMKHTVELLDERDEKHYAWLRQLLVLASGVMAALVALRTGENSSGTPLLALRVAWVALGLGILLGALALRGQVARPFGLAKRMLEETRAWLLTGAVPTSPFDAPKPAIYRFAEASFYLALCVAVISLVTHAVLR